MSSQFVISLDFELMWGVRDHRNIAEYGDAVLGVREALPKILKVFERFEVRATWATVGFLFARDKSEILDILPSVQPQYVNTALSPYRFIESELGNSEKDDPYHFGRSLLDQISDIHGQEIGTHTFSHYYCLEPGQSELEFSADLRSAIEIARAAGYSIESIVFPRNQMNDKHVDICVKNGIDVYRGNPEGYAYRSRPGGDNTLSVRGVRLIDGVMPVAGRMDCSEYSLNNGAVNVQASRFLRPWSKRMPGYSLMHVKHIQREMRLAARTGQHYHLWWHPHNMGRNIEANIDQLISILSTYRELRESHGMVSKNMSDCRNIVKRRKK